MRHTFRGRGAVRGRRVEGGEHERREAGTRVPAGARLPPLVYRENPGRFGVKISGNMSLRSRISQAVRVRGEQELAKLQRNPLTRANFSLYSKWGRVYAVCFLAFLAVLPLLAIRHWIIWGLPSEVSDRILLIVGAVGIGSMFTLVVLMYFKHRRIHRMSRGLCPDCGYDLRATERCPECGSPAPSPLAGEGRGEG